MAVNTTEERELIRAQARYVRSSARKARLVLEHIRGLPATDAEAVLKFQTRAVARDAGKVLKSAVSNAENNFGHDADDLVVVAAYADEGPTLKRWRARARGRVNRIRKRTCHITITVSPALPGEIKQRPVRAPRPQREDAPVDGGRRRGDRRRRGGGGRGDPGRQAEAHPQAEGRGRGSRRGAGGGSRRGAGRRARAGSRCRAGARARAGSRG